MIDHNGEIEETPQGNRIWVPVAIATLLGCLTHLGLGLAISWSYLTSGGLAWGNDDFMRLVQVYDLLDGAGWYDLVQERLAPPSGVLMHWSRLPDLPLALMIGGLEPFIGREFASTIAVSAVPALLMIGTVLLLCLVTARAMNRESIGFSVILFLLAIQTMSQFLPTRVDHHNWQLFLSMAMLYGVMCAFDEESSWKPIALVGVCSAMSLWIGQEAILLIGLSQACLVFSAIKNDKNLRFGLLQAELCFVLAFIFLMLGRPMDALFEVSCDSHSIFYVALTAASMATWLAILPLWKITQLRSVRFIGAGLLGGGALVAALSLFPQCLDGPFSQMDQRLMDMWLPLITEARSAWSMFIDQPAKTSATYLFAALGLGVTTHLMLNRPEMRKPALTVFWLFLIVAFTLALFQNRGLRFAELFAIVPIAWLFHSIIDLHREDWGLFKRWGLALLVLFFVSPALHLTLNKLSGSNTENTPNFTQAMKVDCNIGIAKAELNTKSPSIIMAPGDMGPSLLFHTHHSVIAAPYHRNASGIMDGLEFFSTRFADTAYAIIDRNKAKYVLLCPTLPEITNEPRSFAKDVLNGKLPDWLRPMPLSTDTQLKLYRVREPNPLRSSLY